jgi:hypothetical protein
MEHQQPHRPPTGSPAGHHQQRPGPPKSYPAGYDERPEPGGGPWRVILYVSIAILVLFVLVVLGHHA